MWICIPNNHWEFAHSPGVQLICVFHGGLGRSGGAFDGCGQLCGSSRQAQHSQGINTVAVQGNPRQCQQQKCSIKCKTITWDEILNILQVWSLNFLSNFVSDPAVGPCRALLWVRWLTPVVKEDWSNTRQWWTRSQIDKTTNECLCGEVYLISAKCCLVVSGWFRGLVLEMFKV